MSSSDDAAERRGVANAGRIRVRHGRETTAPSRCSVLMVTVAWGDWHVDAHLRANLPSLLADGNLPGFVERHDLRYVVYTAEEDIDRLRNDPAMQRVARLMRVEMRLVPKEDKANPIATHHRLWAAAAAEARAAGGFVLYMPPDVAWSDGSFMHLADLLNQGFSAIFMTYLRVVCETFVPALRERVAADGTTIAIEARDLVRLSLSHLHPLMAAHARRSRYFPVHPEMILWPVRNEGVCVRVLAREMFLFDPGDLTTNRARLAAGTPDASRIAVIDDSDALYAISLAPLGKDVAWHTTPRRADPIDVANWWLSYESQANDLIAGTGIAWHQAPKSPDRWRRVEVASGLWVERVRGLREALRAWRHLTQHGNHTPAMLLAAAIYNGVLMRIAGRKPGAAIILVPVEASFQALPLDWVERAADPGVLARLIGRHVVLDVAASPRPLHERLGDAPAIELTVADGAPITLRRAAEGLRIGDALITSAPQPVGGHIAYDVDGLVDRRLREP